MKTHSTSGLTAKRGEGGRRGEPPPRPQPRAAFVGHVGGECPSLLSDPRRGKRVKKNSGAEGCRAPSGRRFTLDREATRSVKTHRAFIFLLRMFLRQESRTEEVKHLRTEAETKPRRVHDRSPGRAGWFTLRIKSLLLDQAGSSEPILCSSAALYRPPGASAAAAGLLVTRSYRRKKV